MVINFCIQVDPKGFAQVLELSGSLVDYLTPKCLLIPGFIHFLPGLSSLSLLVILVEIVEHRVFGDFVWLDTSLPACASRERM